MTHSIHTEPPTAVSSCPFRLRATVSQNLRIQNHNQTQSNPLILGKQTETRCCPAGEKEESYAEAITRVGAKQQTVISLPRQRFGIDSATTGCSYRTYRQPSESCLDSASEANKHTSRGKLRHFHSSLTSAGWKLNKETFHHKFTNMKHSWGKYPWRTVITLKSAGTLVAG